MKPSATVLVWLSFLVGLPQVLICGVTMFSAGWWAPLVAVFALSPLIPLILMQEIGTWRRLEPEVLAAIALLSIAISGAFYGVLYYRMQ
jgi:uncharacterized RDD family membrane protein YckC